MQYSLKVDIAFSIAKTIVGWLQRATWKDTEFKVLHSFKTTNWNQEKKIVILKCKKRFFLRKLTKMSNLILCFLEIPKIFIYGRVFLLVSSLQFYTLEIR